jgi:hypothetical protein
MDEDNSPNTRGPAYCPIQDSLAAVSFVSTSDRSGTDMKGEDFWEAVTETYNQLVAEKYKGRFAQRSWKSLRKRFSSHISSRTAKFCAIYKADPPSGANAELFKQECLMSYQQKYKHSYEPLLPSFEVLKDHPKWMDFYNNPKKASDRPVGWKKSKELVQDEKEKKIIDLVETAVHDKEDDDDDDDNNPLDNPIIVELLSCCKEMIGSVKADVTASQVVSTTPIVDLSTPMKKELQKQRFEHEKQRLEQEKELQAHRHALELAKLQAEISEIQSTKKRRVDDRDGSSLSVSDITFEN